MTTIEPGLPAVHALHLSEVCHRWGVSSDELFADLDLSAATLSAPHVRLDLRMVERLVARARILTGEPAIGIVLGMWMPITAYGELGLAAMTASTAREALELATRFTPAHLDPLALRLEEQPPSAALVVDENASLGSARDAVLFAFTVGVWRIASTLTGRVLEGVLEVTFEKPAYFDRFSTTCELMGPVHFSQPANRLVFASDVLDLPLTTADPPSNRIVVARMEQNARLQGSDDLVARVHSLVASPEGTFRTLERVASQLGLSSRTLKRKLAARRTSYTDLLAEARRERAEALLQGSGVTIEGIATCLGYSEMSSFTRAFRRWTGTTPSEFRRRQQRLAATPI